MPGVVVVNQPTVLVGDGTTSPVKVTPASTAAVAADKALVVTVSPNSAPLQVTTSPSGATTGDVFGRVLYGGSAGVLTAVRATAYVEQTTNFTGSIRSANVNDTAAGTGARTVKITYYDQTGAGPLTETVTVNGTTAVNLVNTNHCFIENIEVVTNGTGGTNAGVITLFTGAGATGTAVGTIGTGNIVAATGDGQTLWAHHYIAVGKTASLFQLGAGTNGNQVGIAFLKKSTPLIANSFEEQITDFIPFLNNGGYSTRTLANPVLIAGFARITAYVISNGTNTNFFANFDYSEV